MPQSEDPITKERMLAHARHIRDHIKGLSASHWTQFDNAPDVVFIPTKRYLALHWSKT